MIDISKYLSERRLTVVVSVFASFTYIRIFFICNTQDLKIQENLIKNYINKNALIEFALRDRFQVYRVVAFLILQQGCLCFDRYFVPYCLTDDAKTEFKYECECDDT